MMSMNDFNDATRGGVRFLRTFLALCCTIKNKNKNHRPNLGPQSQLWSSVLSLMVRLFEIHQNGISKPNNSVWREHF